MELKEIVTGGLNYSPQIQSTTQTSSRFIDRFIRLKTTYWNRGFVIVLLTFIGFTILQFQWHSIVLSLLESYEEYNVAYFNYGMCVGFIPGGVLATVYPAHNIFGISFIVSSIYHFMEVMNKEFFLNADLHHLFQFCAGTTMAIACSATHRVCTFWIPLNKQSLRYVPILLWTMAMLYIQLYYIEIHDILKKRTGFIVKVMLAWFVLWLYVINGDRSQTPNRGFILFRLFRDSNTVSSSSRISVIALKRSIISDIPWKSFLTSMPVIVLVVSYMCYSIVYISKYNDFNNYYLELNKPLRKHTTIMLLLLFVLVELFPEITVCFSVTNVRKLFSCTIFIATGVVFLLGAFKVKNVLFLETTELFNFIFNEMEYFQLFGFNFNHLDIAPKYASVLYGFQMTIYNISWIYLPTIMKKLIISELLNDFQTRVLMAVLCLAVAVFYAIFGSAKIQPWAEDKPVKENQRHMHEEVILPAV